MPIDRSTAAGLTAGVVLLAGFVGFAVGLPEVAGDSGQATADIPELPDRLGDDVVALSAVTPEEADAQGEEEAAEIEQFTERVQASDREAAKHLASLYDDAAVRSYVSLDSMTDPQSQGVQSLGVTVVPGEAGLVIPRGPFQIDSQGTHYELRDVDGYRCGISFNDQVDPTTGMPAEGGEANPASYQVECRAERDGLAYSVFANGFDEQQVAGFLDSVLAATD
ncbi:hypothetical protein [Nocardioides sp. SYSU DS0651]|uniref:hypothetical protein n=1 Tax=Nocardioides sp. SYSU DS0651 TaxID=3415955 RepID=UPI003F4BB1DD